MSTRKEIIIKSLPCFINSVELIFHEALRELMMMIYRLHAMQRSLALCSFTLARVCHFGFTKTSNEKLTDFTFFLIELDTNAGNLYSQRDSHPTSSRKVFNVETKLNSPIRLTTVKTKATGLWVAWDNWLMGREEWIISGATFMDLVKVRRQRLS